jgi:hypothetical protein
MFQLKAEKDRNLIEKEKQHLMLRFLWSSLKQRRQLDSFTRESDFALS